MIERKHYIDNLRWLLILFLIPYHAAMAWNCWGEDNYIWFGANKILSSMIVFTSPWFMPLLFVLAGISTKYSLIHRSHTQFIHERVRKLFFPLIAGILTVVAFLAYLADIWHNAYTGSFFCHYSVFLTNISDMTGYDGYFTPGHLWFLLYLFIISLLAIPIIKIQRHFFPSLSFDKYKRYCLSLMQLLLLAATPVLNFGGKSLCADFCLFLLGYYILSEESILILLTKNRYIYMCIMLLCNLFNVYQFVWVGCHTEVLLTLCNVSASWFGILGILGAARYRFNHNTIITRYLSSRSFMIYIFHFGWLLTFQYVFRDISLPILLFFLIINFMTVITTLFTCELVRRMPILRFFFGAKSFVNVINTDK